MTRKVLATTLVLIFMTSLFGCATGGGYYDPGRSTAAGALGGAAAGAALGSIIGAATGSPATGAWVGAATGAIAGGLGGYLYSAHQNKKAYDAHTAARNYNYNPSQGNVVKIDSASVSPSSVNPGQQVNMQMTYTLLNPNNVPTTVTISRQITKDGVAVGQPYQTQVSNSNGTYSDQVGYTLPTNASPGNYTVTSRITSSYGSDQETSSFTVM